MYEFWITLTIIEKIFIFIFISSLTVWLAVIITKIIFKIGGLKAGGVEVELIKEIKEIKEELPVPEEDLECKKFEIIKNELIRTKEKKDLLYNKLIEIITITNKELRNLLVEKGVEEIDVDNTVEFKQFELIIRSILFMINGNISLFEKIKTITDDYYISEDHFSLMVSVNECLKSFYWSLEEKVGRNYSDTYLLGERIEISKMRKVDINNMIHNLEPPIRNIIRESIQSCIDLDKRYNNRKKEEEEYED